MLGYSSKEYTPSQWGRHGGRMTTGSQDVGGTEVASSPWPFPSVKAVYVKRAPQPLTEPSGGGQVFKHTSPWGGHFTFELQQGGSSRVRCLGPITRSLSSPEASLTVQKNARTQFGLPSPDSKAFVHQWEAFTHGKRGQLENLLHSVELHLPPLHPCPSFPCSLRLLF